MQAPLYQPDDTIVAPLSPAGQGAVCLVRVSGPLSKAVVSLLTCKPLHAAPWPARTVRLVALWDGDALLDRALVTTFDAPASYTGEDCAEWGLHASPYVVNRFLTLCTSLPGVRMAQPGEFTWRAFTNGKMDLSRAEAVADLIAAENPLAHRLAMTQLEGGFERKIAALRDRMTEFAALLELELDFSLEDVEFADRTALLNLVLSVHAQVVSLRDSFAAGEVIRKGVPTVLAGRPNAGKSSLLNALLQDARALVSDQPGTTRDTIEEPCVIEGITFRLMDTAGLRESTDAVEQMGVARTHQKLTHAGLVLMVASVGEYPDEAWLNLLNLAGAQSKVLVVLNKVDLPTESGHRSEWLQRFPDLVEISAQTGQGMEVLRQRMRDMVDLGRLAGDFVAVNVRQRESLDQADASLQHIVNGLQQNLGTELLAEEMRNVLRSLAELTGDIVADDLLGAIFSKFCIGK
ncbi:MAG: tRNA uridine-5-carboxymethylaminomethyl(34) synthesis GTPase MnmE [Sphingomonadales bacterium]|nr:tRNA uridine-5-carboxymethylaminomethyl(34) synthesis GTPase MnmE [Bacteroidota bacterium]MBM3912563.1 tRNA uridine-5-carboxymethylaminomethyl(34) synthesis GTPase MnmE [Sphingomonadales bacterium]